MEPRDYALRAEDARIADDEPDEAFSGYGLMGLPFASGHVLGLRRFPASSIGPGYFSVWHRDPAGRWDFYSDVEPMMSCNRFFGAAVTGFKQTEIVVRWPEPRTLVVEMPSEEFLWETTVEATPATRLMSAMGSVMPEPLWKSGLVLNLMGRVAGPLLGAGKLRLSGAAPNRQWFKSNPKRIWAVASSRASLKGEDFGKPGPLAEQAHMGDFMIPQRGILAIGGGFFEPLDEARHLTAATKAG
jgi:hypothetical protein